MDEDRSFSEDESVHTAYGRSRRKDSRGISAARGGSRLWLLSFTDVIALMLTFFVLLFAMSTPQSEEWEDITSALHQELNRSYGAIENKGISDKDSIDKITFGRALNIGYLRTLIDNVIEENEVLQVLTLTVQGNNLMLSLPQDLLFDTGDASVKSSGEDAVYALGGALSRIKNKIEVLGHADPRVIKSTLGKYSNNWELSLARAASVAALLESVGYSRDITIRGLSRGRYEDLQNIPMSEDERMSLSRRVDIVIRGHDGNVR